MTRTTRRPKLFALALAFAALSLCGAASAGSGGKAARAPWKILGPGGGGARYRPTVSPHDPNTVLVACDVTGSYITREGGRTRRRLGGYDFKWGHRPVVDPHRRGMLYLTTFGSSVWHGPADGAAGAPEDVHPFK